MILKKKLTEQIIKSAIEVHRHLGPGLLESAYEECLCHGNLPQRHREHGEKYNIFSYLKSSLSHLWWDILKNIYDFNQAALRPNVLVNENISFSIL